MKLPDLNANFDDSKSHLKSSRFYLGYKGGSETVDWTKLVSLIKAKGPFFIQQLRFDNPIAAGEGRNRQLHQNEMLQLWQAVERKDAKSSTGPT